MLAADPRSARDHTQQCHPIESNHEPSFLFPPKRKSGESDVRLPLDARFGRHDMIGTNNRDRSQHGRHNYRAVKLAPSGGELAPWLSGSGRNSAAAFSADARSRALICVAIASMRALDSASPWAAAIAYHL